MIARGELPNIARLKSGGASGILLSDEPMISPILWNSIATGKTPDLHGVTWFMTDGPAGEKIPVSSLERRVRAFWDIASEAGMKCGITGWWATWPADSLRGCLVSDAVAWHSFGVSGRSNPDDGKTWPRELVRLVDELMPDPAHVSDELMTRLIHLPAERMGTASGDAVYDDPINHLRQAIATTRGYTDLTLDLLERERPRVMSVYYEGTDAVTHLFSRYEAPRLPWISAEDHAAYGDVLAEYWKWQDEIVGELLARRGPETTVLLISDHGFRKGPERRREERFRVETADKDHSPDGVIIVNGPDAVAGGRIEDADIYDVTPTILYLLDLPIARDMVGHPLTDAFTKESRRARAPQWVATYETSAWRTAAGLPLAHAGEDLQKMLRSLGYLGGTGAGGDPQVGYTCEQTVNLATVLMHQGRADEAVKKLQGILAEAPRNFEIRLNLAQALYRAGRGDESVLMYSGLIEDFPERLEAYEDFAVAMRLCGDYGKALEIYDLGIAHSAEWVSGLAGKGTCLVHLGEVAAGTACLEQACRIDPCNHDALLGLGLAQRQQGDLPGAARSLARALQLESADAHIAVALSEVSAEMGDRARAIRTIETTVAKGGQKSMLLGCLGSLQLGGGDAGGALETLLEAHRLDRRNPRILGDLGMAYAMSGSLPAAISTFEKLAGSAPEMADAHAQLGALYAENGQLDRARASLGTAVGLAPDNPWFRLNLALLLEQLGDRDEAAAQFAEVIRLDPANARAYYGLGRIEMQRGNRARAEEMTRTARELDARAKDLSR